MTSTAPLAVTASRVARLGQRLRHVDLAVLASTAGLAVISVTIVYSVTRPAMVAARLDGRLYLTHQVTWFALGAAALFLGAVVDYRRFEPLAVFAYAGVVVLLVGVISPLGASAKGAQRWFNVGSFQLQPSAFTAPALILALAALLSGRGETSSFRLAAAVALAGVPLGLLLLQPDLGSAIILGAVLITVLVLAGADARWVAVLVVAATVAMLVAAHVGILKHYQVQRLTAFVNQGDRKLAATYNLQQSKIAIGSGGVLGKGLFHGTQTNLAYVPEQHTDFIFTAVGEQFGFVGSCVVLGLLASLVWRAWRGVALAADRFGSLICAGVVGLLAIQVIENVGMTVGILPVTGIPLPLMSYGGSSVIATCFALGLVVNVQMRRYR